MTTKKIVFIVMCAILAIMIIVAGIAIAKVGALAQSILDPADPTTGSTSASDATQSTTDDPAPTGTIEATDGTDHVHAYTKISSTPATCNEEGQTVYKCSCGDTDIEVIPALSHSYGPGQVIFSCEEGDYTKYECSKCGHIEKRNETEPTGHKLVITQETPATCEEQASTSYKCTNNNCNYTETVFTGTPLGHSFTNKLETVAVTCTTDGYTLYSCTNDGCTAEPKKTDIISAEGHKFIKWEESGSDMKTVCEKSGCDVTVHSSELEITDEWCSEDGSYYVIEVGTKDIRRLYTYDIEDKRSSNEREQNPIDYKQIHQKEGLIIQYTDPALGPQHIALGFTNYKHTIESSTPTAPGDSQGTTSDSD